MESISVIISFHISDILQFFGKTILDFFISCMREGMLWDFHGQVPVKLSNKTMPNDQRSAF
jgi:hypothetical protein